MASLDQLVISKLALTLAQIMENALKVNVSVNQDIRD
jgi:hypothetical protein